MMHFQHDGTAVETVDSSLTRRPRRKRAKRIGRFVRLSVHVTRSAIEVSRAYGIDRVDHEVVAEVRRALGLGASLGLDDVFFEEILAEPARGAATSEINSCCERLLDVVALALEGTGLAVVEAHLQHRFGRYALRLRVRPLPSMLDDWPSDPRNESEWDQPFCLPWVCGPRTRAQVGTPGARPVA